MKEADGSIERLGFVIASSRYYASAEHVRDRSLRKRSRAFWVDLLDAVPSVEEADIIRRTLENPQNDLQAIVRTLIYSPKVGPTVAPAGTGSAEQWVDATYLRFLLRLPKGPERNEAIVEFGRDDDGWRRLLLDLGLRQEYARY